MYVCTVVYVHSYYVYIIVIYIYINCFDLFESTVRTKQHIVYMFKYSCYAYTSTKENDYDIIVFQKTFNSFVNLLTSSLRNRHALFRIGNIL